MLKEIVEKYWEDFSPEDEWISPGRTVTEADITLFSGLSGDFNRPHTDEEYAKKTPFKKRIAQGTLGLIISQGLTTRVPDYMQGVTFGALLNLNWDFKKPIFIGDTLTLKMRVLEKKETKSLDRGILTFERKLINQRDETVQIGTVTLLVGRKPDREKKK